MTREESDFVFIEDTPIVVGQHGQTDFVFAGGKKVENSGGSQFVFEEGTGLGFSEFAVTIDSTNEPIEEGDTLDVKATITNANFRKLTQFIELSIDNGVGVVDSQEITLSKSASKTITLSWDTDVGDGQSSDYTATVSSLDDSDTEGVEVFIKPGDSATLDWATNLSQPVSLDGDDSAVYVVESGSDLKSLEKSDGSENWTTLPYHDNALQLVYKDNSVAFTNSGGIGSGSVYEYSPSGSQRFDANPSNTNRSLESCDIGQYDGEDVIFAGSTSRNVNTLIQDIYAFETGTGTELWNEVASVPGAVDFVQYTQDILFYAESGSPDIHALELTDSNGNATRNEIGPYTLPNNVKAIAAVDGDVIATTGSEIVRISGDLSTKKWETSVGHGAVFNIYIDRGRAWIVDRNTLILAYDIADGSQIFSDSPDSDRAIYVHADGIKLYVAYDVNNEVRRYDVS